jgi:hypothetical protein
MSRRNGTVICQGNDASAQHQVRLFHATDSNSFLARRAALPLIMRGTQKASEKISYLDGSHLSVACVNAYTA